MAGPFFFILFTKKIVVCYNSLGMRCTLKWNAKRIIILI